MSTSVTEGSVESATTETAREGGSTPALQTVKDFPLVSRPPPGNGAGPGPGEHPEANQEDDLPLDGPESGLGGSGGAGPAREEEENNVDELEEADIRE